MPQNKIADNNLTVQERNQLVEENLGLVYKFASKLCKDSSRYDDCIQEGCLGLMRAARLYNPTKHKNKFSTFASFEIQCAIKDFLWYHNKTVRLPDAERSAISKFYSTVRHLEAISGTISEVEKQMIAEDCGISCDTYFWISQNTSSLNSKCTSADDDNSTELESIVATTQTEDTIESKISCSELVEEMKIFFEEAASYDDEVKAVINAWMTEFVHKIYNEPSLSFLDVLRKMYPQHVCVETDSAELKKQKYKDLDRINCRMNYIWNKSLKDFREYLRKKALLNSIKETVTYATR